MAVVVIATAVMAPMALVAPVAAMLDLVTAAAAVSTGFLARVVAAVGGFLAGRGIEASIEFGHAMKDSVSAALFSVFRVLGESVVLPLGMLLDLHVRLHPSFPFSLGFYILLGVFHGFSFLVLG